MKMTRKIAIVAAAAMLCLAAAFAATGCQQGNPGKQAAIDAYKQASISTIGKEDMNVSADYEVDINLMGQSLTADGSFDFAYKLPGKKGSLLDLEALLDFAMDMDMPEAAGAEDTKMDLGLYLTDRTLYLNMSVPGTDPMKMGITLEDSDFKELDSALSSMGEIDLDSLRDQDMFPIDDYVLNGSFENGKLEMDIDIIGYTMYVMNESSKLSNGSLDETIEQIEQIKSAIKDPKCHFTANINSDGQFENMKMDISMTLDAAAVSGADSSMSMDMDIEATFDCHTIDIDTGKDIKFPSFKGYEVQKVKAEDLLGGFMQMAG